MARIYTLCSQVVVYLGPDLAPVLPEGRYPRRMRLSEFEDGADGMDVRDLLKRRYFSRLWVVQELILAPRVVLRFADVEFHSDGTTSGSLWKYRVYDTPWVQHASRGAPLDLDLLQAMGLVASTACGDPRDRLFGVMGIISDTSWHLNPDYSIPVQHVFIGLFAHLLIAKAMPHLLAFGSGVAGPSSVPSWVPDWTSWGEWQGVFDQTRTGREDLLRTSFYVSMKRGSGPFDSFATVMLPLHYSPLGAPRYGTLTADATPQKASSKPFRLLGTARHRSALLGVGRMTGALGARMVRLLVLNSPPEPLPFLDEHPMLTLFEVRCGEHTLYLSSAKPLDQLVKPGSDCLYLFPLKEKGRTPGICILRNEESLTTGTSKVRGNFFQLVATCETVLFHSSVATEPRIPVSSHPPFQSSSNRRHLMRKGEFDFPGWTDGPLASLDTPWCVGELFWSLCEVMERTRAWLEAELHTDEQLLFGLGSRSTQRDCLSVYWALVKEAEDTEGAYRQFAEAYKQHALKQSARINETDVIYVLSRDATDAADSFETLDHRASWLGIRGFKRTEDGEGYVVPVGVRRVYEKLTGSDGAALLALVQTAARISGESEDQLLSRTPTESDCHVRVPTGPLAQRLLDDFGCDGTTEELHII
jgi:hypothetical protein